MPGDAQGRDVHLAQASDRSSLTYTSALLQVLSPLVLGYMLYWAVLVGDGASLYLAGSFVMAVLYSLFYAFAQRSPLWWYGMLFVAVYMLVLVWQNYWAAATLRDTSWGTRATTARPSRSRRMLERATRRLGSTRLRLHPRSRLTETVLGVLMLPLSFLPIYLYSRTSRDGYLIWTHVASALRTPAAMAPELLSFLVATTALFMVAIVARRLRRRVAQRVHPPSVQRGDRSEPGQDATGVVTRAQLARDERQARTQSETVGVRSHVHLSIELLAFTGAVILLGRSIRPRHLRSSLLRQA